jgi:maltose O-acetyltransferase
MAPMTEKQRMLAGELYCASDPELMQERRRARALTRLYNLTTEEELDQRQAILRELLGSVGSDVWVEPPVYCDYGSNIRLGSGAYLNFGCVILDCNIVDIGAKVLFGPSVQIYAASHPTSAGDRASGLEHARPVTIGDNTWIGGGAIVCPGVTVGGNTTIGAGSVVVTDVPANVIAAGNPCRVIRELDHDSRAEADLSRPTGVPAGARARH